MNSAEKKKIFQAIKAEIDQYLKLEVKLDSLQSKISNGLTDPNISSEEEILKEEMCLHVKKVISTIEENNLVSDMPKEIESVYMELKAQEKS